MPNKAIPGAGNTGRRNGTENVSPVTSDNSTLIATDSDYHTIRTSAYENVLNDALDTLASSAVRFAFIAGRLADDPNITAEHREAMQAISDAVAFRLRERCMAYESILRTTPVPETTQSTPQRRKFRVRQVHNA